MMKKLEDLCNGLKKTLSRGSKVCLNHLKSSSSALAGHNQADGESKRGFAPLTKTTPPSPLKERGAKGEM